MRILFAGTPKLALPTLRSLVVSGHEVVCVLTASDKKSGRGQKLTSSPVKIWSQKRGLFVLSPSNLNDHKVIDTVKALKADLMVVFAYGKIFRREFLDLFPLGAINVHPSLLPRHRGPSPLVATLLALDNQVGITVQKMALKMDTGNILIQTAKDLIGTETLEDLVDWISLGSPSLVAEAIDKIRRGEIGYIQEEEQATYCYAITKEMGYLSLDDSPEVFVARVRALNPSPGTRILTLSDQEVLIRRACLVEDSEHYFTGMKGDVLGLDSKKGMLLRVGNGLVSLLTLQRQGKKECSAQNFWNGVKGTEKLGFKSFVNGE